MNMSHLCMQCKDTVSEFDTIPDLQKHIKEIHQVARRQASLPQGIQNLMSPVNIEKPNTQPVVLKYIFEGTCGVGHAIDTIELEELETVVAYCTQCKKKIKEQKVIPIGKQEKK